MESDSQHRTDDLDFKAHATPMFETCELDEEILRLNENAEMTLNTSFDIAAGLLHV